MLAEVLISAAEAAAAAAAARSIWPGSPLSPRSFVPSPVPAEEESSAFLGYGWLGFLFGLGGGMAMSSLILPPLLAASFSSLEKNFCAWLRIWTAVFVPMCSSIFLHCLPNNLSPSKNLSCSASVHRSLSLVIVYGFLT